MNKATDFAPGQRVQMHPATSLWMRGARFGTVLSQSRALVRVQLDKLAKPVRVHPDNLMPVEVETFDAYIQRLFK